MVWHPGQHKRIEPTIPTKFGVRMANSRLTLIFILRNKSYRPLTVSVHLSLGQIRRDWQSALVCGSYSIFLGSIFEHFPGLDPSRFRTSATADERDFAPLGSQLSDEVRFQDCEKFMVSCRNCRAAPVEFAPPGKSTVGRMSLLAFAVSLTINLERLPDSNGLGLSFLQGTLG